MSEAGLFSEDYYRDVLKEFGYSAFELRRFDFPLGGRSAGTLNARYLCHHFGDQFATTAPSDRIITTGFGMSGTPHLATVAHILRMIEMQQAGENCQIVLGDLDAYNGKVRPYAEVSRLATQFEEFAVALGFDAAAGVVRRQAGFAAPLETMYLLGRYVGQADFDSAEEDAHGYYAARGLVDSTMTFRRALSLTLMAADFISLGQDYGAVMVMLGIDEHRYVQFAQQARARLDHDTPLRPDFVLAAAYTRMVSGFGGHPKFSKSLPGSAIDVRTSPGQAAALLQNEPADPELSATYQLMCLMPLYPEADLLRLYELCKVGGAAWHRQVTEFTDYVNSLTALWPH